MKEKILLIDDEPDVLNALKRLFTFEDYQVKTASSGEEGIKIATSESFDLVITDIRMPGINGVEVIKQIKQVNDDIEIIALTGYASLDNAIEVLKNSRAFDFLQKPLDNIETILNTVHQALEKKRLRIENRNLLLKLKQSNEELEQRVKERTYELQIAKEAAEIANVAKNEFIQNISHELRTPLSVTIGFLDILLDSIDQPDHLDMLKTIKNSVSSYVNIVNDIINFSNLERNIITLTKKDFYLKSTVEDVIQIMSLNAKEKNLSLSYQIAPDVPNQLKGDQNRLRQILFYIVGNALRFTNKGGCQIKISKDKDDIPTSDSATNEVSTQILFSIEDTGIGIPETKKDIIFDYFSQVDQSLSRRYEGIGIGLAICKKMVHLMGGTIWFKSQVNKGSTFYFTVQMTYRKPN